MQDCLYDLLGAHDRLIMDPVHGGITLFRHEIKVIDHPIFQRLRHICQNDILSLVFPGATHSRFLHSVGAMHVGNRMFKGLIESCLARRRSESTAPDISRSQLEAVNFFNKVTRLACLLHDCGHSSFSHQFSKVDTINDMLREPDRFEKLWRSRDASTLYDAEPKKLEHEHYSVRCAYEILSEINISNEGLTPRDVICIMETTHITPGSEYQAHAKTIWPLFTGEEQAPIEAGAHVQSLLRLLVSGEIDADRADYMLRDGFHSSVTIGGFNLDHLLKSLHVGWQPSNKWMGLSITSKGLGALEDFVYSRHQMYRKVYGHKTSIGFDWLLRKAIEEVLQHESCRQFIDGCLTDLSEFSRLTDSYFWEQFRHIAHQDSHSFSRRIIDRRRLHHLDSAENLSNEEVAVVKAQLAELNKISASQIICCTLKTRFSNIRQSFSDIKVLSSHPNEVGRCYQNISDVSSFFNKFSDGVIMHFYSVPEHLAEKMHNLGHKPDENIKVTLD